MGLATLLGSRPQGFFIPHRYADHVAPCDYPALAARFAARLAAFDRVLADLEAFAAAFERFGGPPPAPRFEQDWFAPLDACVAYVMVATRRPQRIVEVGSGHSTRFLARAIADQALGTTLTCIDPAPRASLRGLPARWQETTIQAAPESWFTDLESGDLLFVDSSHIMMPGTDVDWLLNRILPALDPGVLIHVHDIFLPDPYPAAWAWRGYNEQQALAALLQGGGYAILFASHYVAAQHRARLADGVLGRLPGGLTGLASSFWLEKQG